VAQGIAHLIENDGKILLLASPTLTEDDEQAIRQGYDSRRDVVETAAKRALSDLEEYIRTSQLEALSWLIAEERMEVKLATCSTGGGIYHEKFGIFTDALNNRVAFTGSGNATRGGLVANYESLFVFWSWGNTQERVRDLEEKFEELWTSNQNVPGVEVYDFTEFTKDLLKIYRPQYRPRSDPNEEGESIAPSMPSSPPTGRPTEPHGVELRPYQRAVVDDWFQKDRRGLLKMATGMGKTYAALALLSRLSRDDTLRAAIIVCPFKHLVRQWKKECQQWGMQPILAFEGETTWRSKLWDTLISVNSRPEQFVSVITTNATFSGDKFQDLLRQFPSEETVLVVDEVHNIGAEKYVNTLPEKINWRLGLSATPERWFDEEGTDRLNDYFGPTLKPELTLKDGLAGGFLCPYLYYPILVKLTDEETETHREISKLIARIGADGAERGRQSLFQKRARLLASAANKMEALRHIMKNGYQEEKFMLFYCGDGTVTEEAGSGEQRQVDRVVQLLGYELNIKVASYTYKDSTEQREVKRSQLENGTLQGLVAIRCLDEGVDIPVVRMGVLLASSTNPRQFIQRRGRLLRKAPGKDVAEIYDMVVVPASGSELTRSERTWLTNEVRRVVQFAELAENAGEARGRILEVQKTFGVLDVN
jgi:superfamily II DNA or RNA helicase